MTIGRASGRYAAWLRSGRGGGGGGLRAGKPGGDAAAPGCTGTRASGRPGRCAALARRGAVLDQQRRALGAETRRFMTAARQGDAEGGGDRATGSKGGVLGLLSFRLQSALRSMMQEREAALAAARLHRQPDTKPYFSCEDLLKKAEACLRFSRRAYERNLTGRALDDFHFEAFGFNLGVRQSMVRRAGRGVFLTRGHVQPGTVLTFFPGTAYTVSQVTDLAMAEFHNASTKTYSHPGMPAFMYRNRYLLTGGQVAQKGRVRDAELIMDGNPYGQSALRYLGEHEKSEQRCDKGWLELEKSRRASWRTNAGAAVSGARTPWNLGISPPANHGWTGQRSKMAMGHLFNHMPAGFEKDVNFYFLQLPEDFDESLLTHVPSINARTGSGVSRARWTVLAIAARARSYGDVQQRYTMGKGDAGEAGKVRIRAPLSLEGEVELYADYGQTAKELGWRAFVKKESPDRFLQPIVAASHADRPVD